MGSLGVKKPLVVTDKTLLKLPAIDELLSKLKTETESLTIFDGGVAEPSVEVALKACETVGPPGGSLRAVREGKKLLSGLVNTA